MKKIFLFDTNILMNSPRSLYVFEDNDIFICDVTLEELDNLKSQSGETGYSAREAIRALNKIKQGGSLIDGVMLPGGGTCKVVLSDGRKNHLDKTNWSLGKPDNRIINTALDINAILVTNDISMQIKADAVGLRTETFKNEEVSDNFMKYNGRTVLYADASIIDEFHENGKIPVEKLILDKDANLYANEYIIIRDIENKKHTALGRYDGEMIRKLRYSKIRPYGVAPRNSGQQFALDALLTPADELPLVIIKGSAGTAKTFLSLAAGLHQVTDTNDYRKLLIFRPNVKFDDDIGYLKGDEMEKIMPLIRPCFDNMEALLGTKGDNAQDVRERINYLFDRGIVSAEAMAYLRGRSISYNFLLIDEAQNMSPSQALGAITRAGVGTKIVMVGDPDQIDNPKLDKKNNGLVYAAEKMLGSKLCAQLTFDANECVRSPLAAEASELLNLKK